MSDRRTAPSLAARLKRGFTLIELMVSIGILMTLGVMLIGFLRGAVTVSRGGTSRGKVYESAQVMMRLVAEDFSQVLGPPPRADGKEDSHAFLVTADPFGRQILCFSRAMGEELSSQAGYDAGRGAPTQDFKSNFEGWNVNDRVKSTGGNIEVCYMLEPTPHGTNLYRAIQSPCGAGGLIDEVGEWLEAFGNTEGPTEMPKLWWEARRFDRRFNLVAENVLCFCIQCWDDNTETWEPRSTGEPGPVLSWSYSQRMQANQRRLPMAVKLTLLIAADAPLRADAMLTQPIGTSDAYLSMDNVNNFPDVGTPDAYARIGPEVVAFGSKGGGGLGSLVRGQYGTRVQSHFAGTRVIAGECMTRVFHLPVTR